MQVTRTYSFLLNDGSKLDVKATDEFLDKVTKQMDLNERSEVTDDHVKMFIFGSLKSSLEKLS